jgi:hypothetical protein
MEARSWTVGGVWEGVRTKRQEREPVLPQNSQLRPPIDSKRQGSFSETAGEDDQEAEKRNLCDRRFS